MDPGSELRLPAVEVFFSPTSIEPGADPYRRMFDEGLLRAEALLVVLTEDGAGSPFVIWETAAAWGRGKLVISVFVDIEPGAVPGPLTTRVQGVQLADRRDLDRALREFAVHFGLSECAALTDEEHVSLTGAALRTGEAPNH
ncbi:MAG: TIR domain-containing protein [Acidimicrobiales bacterium]